jgi:hypothetical protein
MLEGLVREGGVSIAFVAAFPVQMLAEARPVVPYLLLLRLRELDASDSLWAPSQTCPGVRA